MNSSDSAGPYQYKPLRSSDEIRLLVFESCADTGGFKCHLNHVNLSHAPYYDALSYAWGSERKPRRIICGGGYISISDNLFEALKRLQWDESAGQHRTLWADGICINQSSNDEKNHQVQLMSQIYSYAEHTLVWLGEDPENQARMSFQAVENASTFLLHIASRHKVQSCNLVEPRISTADRTILRLILIELLPIFNLPWFQRLWVVQEVVLAQRTTVFWGSESITFSNLVDTVQELDNLLGLFTLKAEEAVSSNTLINYTGVGFLRQTYRKDSHSPFDERFHILELMHRTSKLQCRNPRDRINALLGLTWTQGLRANYSLDVPEVYMDLANWYLRAFKDLRLLSYAQGVTNTLNTLPTWAPSPDFGHLGQSLTNAPHFQASGLLDPSNSKCSWAVIDRTVLQVQAFFVDSISKIVPKPLVRGPTIDDIDISSDSASDYRAALLDCLRIAGIGGENEKSVRSEKFYKAMAFELENTMHRSSAEFYAAFQSFFLAAIQKYSYPETPLVFHEEDLAGPCILARWAFHRRFCVTANDRFAWVPKLAQPGDKICIVNGAKIPFVARESTKGYIKLVGECWIQGLMKGEALCMTEFSWEHVMLV
jgi:heterokaryon incompatibility protein (HET)